MKQVAERSEKTVKINLPGGIVAWGDLYQILIAAEGAGIKHVRFGNRQQLFLQVENSNAESLEEDLLISDIEYEINSDSFPNIVSSYVTVDIFEQNNWLREGVYKDILDLFDFKPRLKINLTDNTQTFVPFFSGNLNFISSGISNYWYLYIRFPKTSVTYCWPSLIYSEDIAALSKTIEAHIFSIGEINGSKLYEKVTTSSGFATQPVNAVLKVPDFALPYYEGFNKYDTKYWLGIYRRDEKFPIDFLKDLCSVNSKTRTGQLYTTPWKSLIIKGIELDDRKHWAAVLAKHRINVRHASNELNWQTEDLCEQGLELKQYLVREFDKADLRTFKLSFAIKIGLQTGLFGSVIIRKQTETSTDLYESKFDVLHTRDFNPNNKDFISYARNLTLYQLSFELIKLCYHFHEISQLQEEPEETQLNKSAVKEDAFYQVFQCKNCLTLYDARFGEPLNNIPAGTAFTDLKENYCCPTCDSGSEAFISINKNKN